MYRSALLFLLLAGCSTVPSMPDLVIRNATVFDTISKQVVEDRAIVVREGVISDVLPSRKSDHLEAGVVIDAQGKLLAPGLIDVHHHTADILADSTIGTNGAVAVLTMDPDSIRAYRRRFAEAYLPYGVAVVREAGGDDTYLEMMQVWMRPVSWAPDFYPSGGALISPRPDGGSFAGHRVVKDSADAVRVVRSYHDAGFHHIKLYWRLRMSEFRPALREALSLGMVPFAHVDYKVQSIRETLDLGLRHFEHAHTLAVEVLTRDEINTVWQHTLEEVLPDSRDGGFFMGVMEMYNLLGEENPRMLDLINSLTTADATVTPTLHSIAGPLGLAWFQPVPADGFADTSGWTEEQMAIARRGYHIMAGYVRQLYESGVPLSLGTDTADPGKSVLSEMLLLHDAGIPMEDVLCIATINSARAMGLESEYGSIEAGKRAHFVLFEENPVHNPEALLQKKTVIKDGVVLEPTTFDNNINDL